MHICLAQVVADVTGMPETIKTTGLVLLICRDFPGDLEHTAAGIIAAHYANWSWHRACILNNRK